MKNAKVIAEARKLLTQYRTMISFIEGVAELGDFAQAADTAMRERDAAFVERDKAAKLREAAEASLAKVLEDIEAAKQAHADTVKKTSENVKQRLEKEAKAAAAMQDSAQARVNDLADKFTSAKREYDEWRAGAEKERKKLSDDLDRLRAEIRRIMEKLS